MREKELPLRKMDTKLTGGSTGLWSTDSGASR
jgi:hypothetical protein